MTNLSTRQQRSVTAALAEVNQRLKDGKRRVSLLFPLSRGRAQQRLYLRATLPPKPEEPQGPPRRRMIALPLGQSAADVKEGEKLALELAGDISDWRNGRPFNWSRWEQIRPRRRTGEVETFGSVVDRLELQFFADRREHPNQQAVARYWKSDFANYFRRLDMNRPYCIGDMREAIEQAPLKSSSRKKLAKACRALMKLQNEPFEQVEAIAELGRGYGKAQLTPRDIPTDEVILRDIESIAPEWQWAFKVIWLFGCRPHELWECEVQPNCLLSITQGKTGPRSSMPRAGQKHLVEDWGLVGNQLPEWFGRGATVPFQNLAMELGKAKNRVGISWRLYDMRHAWAISGIKAGTNIRTAAKSLGHTVAEHERTYTHWISEQELLAAMLKEVS